jgi:hypothetical protein
VPILSAIFAERVGTTNLNPPFFFRVFAEDYHPFPHTIQVKGQAMGGIGNEQKQGAPRHQTPVFALPPPPHPG